MFVIKLCNLNILSLPHAYLLILGFPVPQKLTSLKDTYNKRESFKSKPSQNQ